MKPSFNPSEPELASPGTGGVSCIFVYNISESSVKQNLRDIMSTRSYGQLLYNDYHPSRNKRAIII